MCLGSDIEESFNGLFSTQMFAKHCTYNQTFRQYSLSNWCQLKWLICISFNLLIEHTKNVAKMDYYGKFQNYISNSLFLIEGSVCPLIMFKFCNFSTIWKFGLNDLLFCKCFIGLQNKLSNYFLSLLCMKSFL